MMNKPKKLNGWTSPMMSAFKQALDKAHDDVNTKVIIFTGAGHYYCAGVNLSDTLKLMSPQKLHGLIVEHNIELFESFLSATKPILVAVNGPAIGASVTSATLCDGIIAAENATFSTPFAALGISPEGCSSIQFARLMGEKNAQRMLGDEGWVPNGNEAYQAGLVQWYVPNSQLLSKAHDIAKQWVSENRPRQFLANSQLDELRNVNKTESVELANRFLGAAFLKGQGKFLWKKKKYMASLVFLLLWLCRPIWGLSLTEQH